MNYRYRINYAKEDGMRYTSNLDVHKMWERTFRRAKLPLVYSQGFHPQPKIQQASPLPLGFLSKNELVDFLLDQDINTDSLKENLSSTLPSGIVINNINQIDLQQPALQTQTEASEYHIFFLDPIDEKLLIKQISTILSETSIKRIRRGKSYDLRPLILEIDLVPESPLFLKMLLKSKEGATGRPEEVLSELNIPVESARIIRNQIILIDSN